MSIGSLKPGFASWSRMLSKSKDKIATLQVCAEEAAKLVAGGWCNKQLVVDEVTERAVIGHGLDPDVVQKVLADALERAARRAPPKANGKHTPHVDPDPRPMSDYRHSERTAPETGEKTSSELQFDRLSDIEPEPIAWIWSGRIARRKLTLLAGDPGMGKSQIGIDIGARITSSGDRRLCPCRR